MTETDAALPSDCNNFGGVVLALGQNDTLHTQRGRAIITRKIVSRGEEISQAPCSTSVGAKNPIAKFRATLNMESSMDRAPKAPPFPVGTRLRYCGTRASYWGWGKDGGICPIVAPGVEVTVDETRPGYRGTLRQIRDEVYDDTGEPILDTTHDGYSVYHVTDPSGKQHGRCIDNDNVAEWEELR